MTVPSPGADVELGGNVTPSVVATATPVPAPDDDPVPTSTPTATELPTATHQPVTLSNPVSVIPHAAPAPTEAPAVAATPTPFIAPVVCTKDPATNIMSCTTKNAAGQVEKTCTYYVLTPEKQTCSVPIPN